MPDVRNKGKFLFLLTDRRSCLKLFYLYTQTFLAPDEGFLQEYLQSSCEYFLLIFFRSGVTVVNFVFQSQEKKITRSKTA
jgi:hypothetical protein